ncbi:MAG: DUF4038 domain-containing protein [Lachnospiraceae bacterium]
MTIACWNVIEIKLRTDKNYESPFEDVDVSADFKGPDGSVLKLNAFWDGDGTWIFRFAPTLVGEWSYTIYSSDPLNSDFTGDGKVTCIPYEGDIPMYQHGFLRVSEDHSYLEHADGTPFFWLGDTHWTFATEEKFDESNHPDYDSQFKACANRRILQKFTVYQSNLRDGDGVGFFGKNLDLMQKSESGFTPNIKEFQTNVDRKMKYLADLGFYHAIGYAWGYDMEKYGVERFKKLAKYTAARYGAYPVAWTLAGEIPGYMGDLDANVALWNEVARECERWNPYQNLQSAHLACSRPFPQIYQNESWFDFAMSQAGHGDFDLSQTMYEEFKEMYRGHPILESEATYEGAQSNELSSRVITDKMMRRLAYLIMQSGGCGYTYGCNGIWELQWEAGVGGIGWGDMAWWDGLELPGADQLTILRNFYESVNWWQLRPLTKEQAETKSFFMETTNRMKIYFTGDSEMRTVVGYISETSMKSFTLRGLTAKEYHLYWVNPENGEKTQSEEAVRPVNGEWSYDGMNTFGNRKDCLVVLKCI